MFEEEIKALAVARQDYAEAKAAYDQVHGAMLESFRIAFAEEIGLLETAKATMEALEKTVRDAALPMLAAGEKPHKALNIRRMKKTRIVDVEKAVAWARANAPVLFVFDDKTFGRWLRDGNITVSKEIAVVDVEPTVTIAENLTAYLEAEAEAEVVAGAEVVTA